MATWFDNEGQTGLFEVWEDDLTTPETLHARIAADFGFPPYYGANLSALADCLGDVDTPSIIVVHRSRDGRQKPWFDGFCTVMERSARENPSLEYRREDMPADDVTLADVLARLERIDRRLDAMQDAPSAKAAQTVSTPVSRATRGEAPTCRNLASGSDGDRFKCSVCGCCVSDYLEETRQLIDGLRYCPQCGCEVTNPSGSNALGWVGELI